MIMMIMIKKKAKDRFGSFRKYALHFKTYPRNFELRIKAYLGKLNIWLEPLGLHVIVEEKKRE